MYYMSKVSSSATGSPKPVVSSSLISAIIVVMEFSTKIHFHGLAVFVGPVCVERGGHRALISCRIPFW
jgi:hypothetical protein